MNPIGFGQETWNFWEALPWFFPNEILNEKEITLFVLYVFYTVRLLPCKSCSYDAQALLKEMDWLNHLGFNIKNKVIIFNR
jgi:hypothetical protein